jgi:hypothetical protein
MNGTPVWFQVALTILLSLASGFIGGLAVAFRLGRWRQSVEDRLRICEDRLRRGDAHVDRVPLLVERVDVLIKTVDEIKIAFRDFTRDVVTRRECDRRHAVAGGGKE